MLEVDDLSFGYGGGNVLHGISLTLGAGVNLILGRNGAGKTTLLRLLAGAAPATRGGEIRLDGEHLAVRTRPGRKILRNVGWLPQEFGYPPHMRTSEFVAYAAWLKEVPRSRIASQVAAALAAAGVNGQSGQRLRVLSGGQLRRAGLAAAVVSDPRLLILDEPTAGLDPEQRESFHELVRAVGAAKVVVIATHLLEDVAALADHIVIIDAGRVRWQGTPARLAHAGREDDTPVPVGTESLRRGLRVVLRGA